MILRRKVPDERKLVTATRARSLKSLIQESWFRGSEIWVTRLKRFGFLLLDNILINTLYMKNVKLNFLIKLA